MEFAENGDILSKVSDHLKKGTCFKEPEIWFFFIQMLLGLKALHDIKVCHRDIKSANIFISSKGIIKLGDFNVSKVTTQGGMMRTQTGTPYYASPEVWKDKPYDIKSDIWSLGCVLYEIIALRPPFKATDMKGLYRKVV
jgi:NIMA (never in mitosis gene a)-related kinase